MGELVELAAYRKKREDEELEEMRRELHRLVASEPLVGFVFITPLPPFNFRVQNQDGYGMIIIPTGVS